MMWGYGMGTGWMVLFWVLLVVGLVVLVAVLVRVLGSGNRIGAGRADGSATPQGGGNRRAREILEERYASGEISTEEYRERLETLREGDR